jgi:hypothetical protein
MGEGVDYGYLRREGRKKLYIIGHVPPQSYAPLHPITILMGIAGGHHIACQSSGYNSVVE